MDEKPSFMVHTYHVTADEVTYTTLEKGVGWYALVETHAETHGPLGPYGGERTAKRIATRMGNKLTGAKD